MDNTVNGLVTYVRFKDENGSKKNIIQYLALCFRNYYVEYNIGLECNTYDYWIWFW